jgi:hypothetical protein
MKKFFLLSAFAAIMSLALLNTSCTEEDVPFNIVGQWKLELDYNTYNVFKLDEDGSCSIVDIIEDFPGDFKFDGTYKYDETEGMLFIYDSAGDERYKYEIINISKDSKQCQWIDKKDPKKRVYEVKKR